MCKNQLSDIRNELTENNDSLFFDNRTYPNIHYDNRSGKFDLFQIDATPNITPSLTPSKYIDSKYELKLKEMLSKTKGYNFYSNNS